MQRLRPRAASCQLISGAGGHEPYPLEPRDDRVAFGTRTPGALRLDLRARAARASGSS